MQPGMFGDDWHREFIKMKKCTKKWKVQQKERSSYVVIQTLPHKYAVAHL